MFKKIITVMMIPFLKKKIGCNGVTVSSVTRKILVFDIEFFY